MWYSLARLREGGWEPTQARKLFTGRSFWALTLWWLTDIGIHLRSCVKEDYCRRTRFRTRLYTVGCCQHCWRHSCTRFTAAGYSCWTQFGQDEDTVSTRSGQHLDAVWHGLISPEYGFDTDLPLCRHGCKRHGSESVRHGCTRHSLACTSHGVTRHIIFTSRHCWRYCSDNWNHRWNLWRRSC